MIAGEIDEISRELSLKFIPIDEKEFEEIEFDISAISSVEELIEKINESEFPENKYIKIILTGSKKIEIEPLKVLRYILNSNIIKVKDKTHLDVNLEELSTQNSLKGIFVRNLLEKKAKEPENIEKIDKAIEIGLSSFN